MSGPTVCHSDRTAPTRSRGYPRDQSVTAIRIQLLKLTISPGFSSNSVRHRKFQIFRLMVRCSDLLHDPNMQKFALSYFYDSCCYGRRPWKIVIVKRSSQTPQYTYLLRLNAKQINLIGFLLKKPRICLPVKDFSWLGFEKKYACLAFLSNRGVNNRAGT